MASSTAEGSEEVRILVVAAEPVCSARHPGRRLGRGGDSTEIVAKKFARVSRLIIYLTMNFGGHFLRYILPSV